MAESNANATVSASGGIGFAGALTIAFIVLKLCGVINWSWLWVLAPLWISFLLGLGIIAIILFIMLIAVLLGVKR